MRKALVPMLACLALCGAATTAMVISSARASPAPHKPMMVAAAQGLQLAANDTPADGATLPPRGPGRRSPADIAARMKQMCQDQYARETGRLAYLETRLDLTQSEQPLFQRWKEATLGVARRHADQCAQRPVPQRQAAQGQNQPAARPSPADRMAREEDRLKQRVADIEAERPALETLYNALSPQQKMELARGGRNDRNRSAGAMMRRPRFANAMGPRGQMGGPMGSGPMGPGPMGGPPGAPPLER